MSSPAPMDLDHPLSTDTDSDRPAAQKRPGKLPSTTTSKKKPRAPKSSKRPPAAPAAASPTPPPQDPKPRTKKKHKVNAAGEQLYCVCAQPDTGRLMVACDGGCTDWFHLSCIGLPPSEAELIDTYICAGCSAATGVTTTWKRKCRVKECRKAARVEMASKYCSPDHGLEFMRRAVARMAGGEGALGVGEAAALVAGVRGYAEWRGLGERVPTPPLGELEAVETEEEVRRKEEICAEREVLEGVRRRLLEGRKEYLALVLERRRRVVEEMKEAGEAGGGGVCGFDERFALDDVEFEAWWEGEEGRAVRERGVLEGREGACWRKRCAKHNKWAELFAEEGEVMERLRKERLVELRAEERKIRERQKRRAVKDPREGRVEVEG